jgi:hypothetical protein
MGVPRRQVRGVKFYAVTTGGPDQVAALRGANHMQVLVSYIADKRRTFHTLMPPELDLLIDSGAFSVWSIGKTVDRAAYRDYLLAYREEKQTGKLTFINLDVIPGDKRIGTAPTQAERERAIRESMDNADFLRDAGLPIMEVYHRFEPPEVLEQLLARRRPGERLGLGALQGRGSLRDKQEFLDECFHVVRGFHGGWSGISPLHGLGIGPGSPLGRRYPWWTADSSSWVMARKFGKKPSRRVTQAAWAYDDPRTAVTPVAELYFDMALRGWQRACITLDKMWTARGVTFAQDIIDHEGGIAT